MNIPIVQAIRMKRRGGKETILLMQFRPEWHIHVVNRYAREVLREGRGG